MSSQVWKVIKNIGKIAYWKCRYSNRLQTSWVQGFDRVHLEIASDGSLQMGERNQNRGTLYLICGEGGHLQLGSHIFCNTGGCITSLGYIQIGDYCKFGNNLVIVDHDHNYQGGEKEYRIGEVIIGERVWVGANCTILQGAHIGDDCVIAAGSVVKGEVPAGTVYYQKRETVMRQTRRP